MNRIPGYTENKPPLIVIGAIILAFVVVDGFAGSVRADPVPSPGTACQPVASAGGTGAFESVIPGSSSTARVIDGVPAYFWHHGCGPTAAGMVFGYWDMNGYPDLFDAEGDDVFLTENVQDQISSPAYNEVFDPTPDRRDLLHPEADSIAAFFGTSRDPLGFGESYISHSLLAVPGYAGFRGYDFDAQMFLFADGESPHFFGWEEFTAEIDAGRPLLFSVDMNGDNREDHYVPVFGYDETASGERYYGIYTTFSEHEVVVWKEWQQRAAGNLWGVSFATFITPLDEPEVVVPGPASLLLMLTGIGMLPLMARRR